MLLTALLIIEPFLVENKRPLLQGSISESRCHIWFVFYLWLTEALNERQQNSLHLSYNLWLQAVAFTISQADGMFVRACTNKSKDSSYKFIT